MIPEDLREILKEQIRNDLLSREIDKFEHGVQAGQSGSQTSENARRAMEIYNQIKQKPAGGNSK